MQKNIIIHIQNRLLNALKYKPTCFICRTLDFEKQTLSLSSIMYCSRIACFGALFTSFNEVDFLKVSQKI